MPIWANTAESCYINWVSSDCSSTVLFMIRQKCCFYWGYTIMSDGNTISTGSIRKRRFDPVQDGTTGDMDTCHCLWVIHGIIFTGVTCVFCSHQTSCGHPLCQLAPMRSMKDWLVGIGKSIVWWSGHSPLLWESWAQDPALMNAQLFMQSRKVWQSRLRKSIPAEWPTWGWNSP